MFGIHLISLGIGVVIGVMLHAGIQHLWNTYVLPVVEKNIP